jgi:hypothetical protein
MVVLSPALLSLDGDSDRLLLAKSSLAEFVVASAIRDLTEGQGSRLTSVERIP